MKLTLPAAGVMRGSFSRPQTPAIPAMPVRHLSFPPLLIFTYWSDPLSLLQALSRTAQDGDALDSLSGSIVAMHSIQESQLDPDPRVCQTKLSEIGNYR